MAQVKTSNSGRRYVEIDEIISLRFGKTKNYTIDDGGGENPGLLGLHGILEHVATILNDDFMLEDGKSLTLTIRRHDMTQAEIDALPEV